MLTFLTHTYGVPEDQAQRLVDDALQHTRHIRTDIVGRNNERAYVAVKHAVTAAKALGFTKL